MAALERARNRPAAPKLESVKAIGYLRVSTEEQAGSGLGLEAQRSAISAAASRLGFELSSFFADEGVSGALPPRERPELALALEQLGAGEVLVVAKRDRLARDRVEIGLLERELAARGVRVFSAAGEGTDGTGSGALLQRGLADLLAEHEREVIRERTRAALAAKRARGERTGAIPFGWAERGGKLVEVLEEQLALVMMRRLRDEGKGVRAIAAALVAKGIPPKRARTWHPSSVKAILATDGRRRGLPTSNA